MSDVELRQALDVHLSNMVGAPPIDFENVGLEQSNSIYLSQIIFPAEDIPVGTESTGTDILAGVYQVTVNVPKGTGRTSYMTEVDRVRNRFNRQQFSAGSTKVTIHKVWTNSALSDENYFRVPVSIRYRAS